MSVSETVNAPVDLALANSLAGVPEETDNEQNIGDETQVAPAAITKKVKDAAKQVNLVEQGECIILSGSSRKDLKNQLANTSLSASDKAHIKNKLNKDTRKITIHTDDDGRTIYELDRGSKHTSKVYDTKSKHRLFEHTCKTDAVFKQFVSENVEDQAAAS